MRGLEVHAGHKDAGGQAGDVVDALEAVSCLLIGNAALQARVDAAAIQRVLGAALARHAGDEAVCGAVEVSKQL